MAMGTFDDATAREALLDAYLHQKARRGFATMPAELRRAISSKGGKAARRVGRVAPAGKRMGDGPGN